MKKTSILKEFEKEAINTLKIVLYNSFLQSSIRGI